MNAPQRPLSRFDFERDVLAQWQGSATGLLLLLVMATHCRRRGSVECFPSLATLEAESRHSRPTVIAAIREAVALGWLDKRQDQLGRMRRRGSVYTLLVPTGKAALPVSSRRPVKSTAPTGKDGDADRLNLQIATGKATFPVAVERSDANSCPLEVRRKERGKELEVGHLKGLSFLLGKIEVKGHSASASASPRPGTQGARQETLDTWAEAHGITRSSRETEDSYRRRAIDGYVKWKASQRAACS